MKRNIMKKAALLLAAVLTSVCVNAQTFDIATADLKLDAPTTIEMWNKTYNTGSAAQITSKVTGAEIQNKKDCNKGEEKSMMLSMSSDSYIIDISIPQGNTSSINSVMFDGVGDSENLSGKELQLWGCQSETFDNTKAYLIKSFSIFGFAATCDKSHNEISIPSTLKIKSLRIYGKKTKKVTLLDAGTNLYSIAGSSGKDYSPSGDKYNIKNFYVWLNKGPEIMTFKAFGQEGRISGDNIIVDVLYATDITGATVPDEITLSPGASFTGANNATTAVNFSETVPVVYDLTDTEGNTKSYNVLINRLPPSTERNLDKLAYVIDGDTRYATISGNTVTVTLPYSYDKKNEAAKKSISTTIDFSDDLANAKLGSGTTVADGVAMNIDYSVPQLVVITSEDGNSTTYNINVAYEEPSAACDLLTFSLPLTGGRSAEGIIDGDVVNVYMTTGDLASSNPFTPVYATSPLSEIAPTISIPMTFVFGVEKPFRVNAEKDLTFKDYKIIVHQDDVAPTVVSVDKPSDMSAASLAGPLQLTFSEAVKLADGSANAGKISIKKKSDGTEVEVWSGVLSISYDKLVGNTTFGGLEGLTDYTLVIENGSLTDYAGNPLTYSLPFKTADGTLHTADLPYCSDMDGNSYEQRAFISAPVYDSEVNTRSATTFTNGAYRLAPGQTLTLTAESVGTVDVIIFSYGQCNYNITAGSASKDGAITVAYDNDGVEEQLEVNSSTTTPIVVTNTGTTEIMIPYISVSAVGSPAVTDKECNCK